MSAYIDALRRFRGTAPHFISLDVPRGLEAALDLLVEIMKSAYDAALGADARGVAPDDPHAARFANIVVALALPFALDSVVVAFGRTNAAGDMELLADAPQRIAQALATTVTVVVLEPFAAGDVSRPSDRSIREALERAFDAAFARPPGP